jgi:hypothetical protein
MRRLKALRFAGGVGVAIVLPALAAFSASQTNPLLGWYRQWLWVLVEAGLAGLVALTVSVLLRPQRPQRLAMLVGGAIGCLMLAVPHLSQGPLFVVALFAPFASASWTKSVAEALFGRISIGIVPLMASCWIGADYWCSESWLEFWRGPGGVVTRGGLLAGAVSAAVAEVAYFGSFTGTAVYSKLVEPRGHQFREFPWLPILAYAPGGVAWGGVVTAVLISRHASARCKAVIGAVIVFAFAVLWLCIDLVRIEGALPPAEFALLVTPTLRFLLHAAPPLVSALSVGAIAGFIAGQRRHPAGGEATVGAADRRAC